MRPNLHKTIRLFLPHRDVVASNPDDFATPLVKPLAGNVLLFARGGINMRDLHTLGPVSGFEEYPIVNFHLSILIACSCPVCRNVRDQPFRKGRFLKFSGGVANVH